MWSINYKIEFTVKRYVNNNAAFLFSVKIFEFLRFKTKIVMNSFWIRLIWMLIDLKMTFDINFEISITLEL